MKELIYIICRCGSATYSRMERIKHLKSRFHYNFQKKLEYFNNNIKEIII